MEGSNGDFSRGNGCDNNVRTQPSTSTSGPQPVRQEDAWPVPLLLKEEMMWRDGK